MIVIRKEHRVFYPKLDIRASLTIDKLFGDVTAPLLSYMSLETQVLLLSLSLQQYNLTDDELYELIDEIEDLNSLILELYQESGLINQDEQQNSTDSDLEQDSEQSSDTSSEVITFESHMMDLLGQCMSIGMSEQEFYNSTLKQITRYVEAHNKQQENDLQQKAFLDYQLANLICVSVGRLMSKDAKYPPFHEAYAFLDTEENKKAREEEERKRKMSEYRAYMMAFAESQNNKQTQSE